ncbi:MAG: iron-containing alcohol dehydrogenase [Anaerolineaceae bacterium]|nr:iron-containing alcohol dehydrogenase [Anaerolineaceae bacterium]
MSFEFVTSDRIVFGKGAISKVREIAPALGRKALIVCGSGSVSLDPLTELLKTGETAWEVFRVTREPDIPTIEVGLALAKTTGCEFVIGFGGGSIIDSAKAISALMTNSGSLIDYLEVIGKGQKILHQAAPMIALPTTAGTGSEVTRNAVIASPEHHVKVSMRSALMIPSVAIVDPALTYSMPPVVTASTGMDALTQVIEAYVSNKANPMTDAIAREGILSGSRSLLAAYRDGSNEAARGDMSLTSLFGGLALANAGLGAVHGFAGPIGGMFNAPHGAICASLLPYVMKYNAQVIRDHPEMAEIGARFRDVARWVTGNPDAEMMDGVRWIETLAHDLEIPGLHEIGIEQSDFPQIIEKSIVSSSMQKNPVRLDEETLEAILMEAY